MLRTTIFVLGLGLLYARPNDGQVRLAISPGEHRAQQYMIGFIRNRGPQTIAVCFELEEKHREDRRPQPFALSVARRQFGEWTAVPRRLGRAGYTLAIKPGENVGLPFTVTEKGQYRLVLRYGLTDDLPANCADLHDGTRATSKPFSISDWGSCS